MHGQNHIKSYNRSAEYNMATLLAETMSKNRNSSF